MYKQIRLTAHEAFEQSNILHKTWNKAEFNYKSFTDALIKVREEYPNAELVLFVTSADLTNMTTDHNFADVFDPVTQKEVIDYGYLGQLASIHTYQNKEVLTQLRERRNSLSMTQILETLASNKVEISA